MRSPKIFILALTFLIAFGLAITLQPALGLNIAGALTGPLDLGNNRIMKVAAPTSASDAATFGWVDSGFQRPAASCPAGQGIRALAQNGAVTCEEAIGGATLGEVALLGSGFGHCASPGDGPWEDTGESFTIPAGKQKWGCGFRAGYDGGTCSSVEARILCNGTQVVWQNGWSFSTDKVPAVVTEQNFTPASCVFQIRNTHAGCGGSACASSPYVSCYAI